MIFKYLYFLLPTSAFAVCATQSCESGTGGAVILASDEFDAPPLDFDDLIPNLAEHNRIDEWMTNVPGYILGLSRGFGASVIGLNFMDSQGEQMASQVSDLSRAEWIYHDGISMGIEEVKFGSFPDPISVQWRADPEDRYATLISVSGIPESVGLFVSLEDVVPTDLSKFTFKDDQGVEWVIEASAESFSGMVVCNKRPGKEISWAAPWEIAAAIKDYGMSIASGYYVPRTSVQTSPAQDISFLFFRKIQNVVFRITPAVRAGLMSLTFPPIDTTKGASGWEGRAASNLLGSMGRFSGELAVSDPGNLVTMKSRKITMTAVGPSRSKFPRPFLWDDGFHLLAIDSINRALAVEIVTSWLRAQLVTEERGWIPRELALSPRDQAAIPREFLFQDPQVANPTSLVLVIRKWINQKFLTVDAKHAIMGHLARWFVHLETTQKSSNTNGKCFRWNPRTADHCLASGLDDYPRGPAVNEDECHLDLHVWMMLLAETVRDLVSDLGIKPSRDWAKIYSELDDALTTVFTPGSIPILADYIGAQLVTSEGGLMYSFSYMYFEQQVREAAIHSPHIGYVSLYPLMTGRLCPVRDKRIIQTLVEVVLTDSLLMSEFGVLSLAKSDSLFGTGENYWRGNIWANMIMLLIGALDAYSSQYRSSDPEFSILIQSKASEIRKKFLDATKTAWLRSGGPREYLNPLTGEGGGAYPFSGWTAAAVAILESDSGSAFWGPTIGIRSC